MILLSFILPVYGVEKYIADCLDSIYSQGLHESEFEVICVDDCSPDNSKGIIQTYQKKYSNLILVEHEINKKSGGARNSGIRMAKGEYIWFVDPDDIIAPNAAINILKECVEHSLDVLCFNYSIFSQQLNLEKDWCFQKKVTYMNGIAFLETVFGESIIFNLGYPVRAVYKRDVILNNHILFVENMPYGEETTFMAHVISFSNRVAAITDADYYYRQTESNSTSFLKKGKGDIVYLSIIKAGEMVLDWKHIISNQSAVLVRNIEKGIPWFVNRLFIRLVRTSITQREIFYKCLSEDVRNGKQHDELYSYMDFKNRFVVKHQKIGIMLLDVLSRLYKLKHK